MPPAASNPSADILEYRAEAQLRESEIEAALSASRALDRREAQLNRLIDSTLDSYARFVQWHDEVIDHWSGSADRYDQRLHQGLDVLGGLWLRIFGLAVRILDRDHDQHGLDPANANRLRQRYSEMLSIEMMDHGPMSETMTQLTERAAQDMAAGRAKEM